MTITLDEAVARWARIWAAEHDTSVSRMVGDLLRERMLREQAYEQAMEEYLAVEPVGMSGGRPYPTREQVHDRRLR